MNYYFLKLIQGQFWYQIACKCRRRKEMYPFLTVLIIKLLFFKTDEGSILVPNSLQMPPPQRNVHAWKKVHRPQQHHHHRPLTWQSLQLGLTQLIFSLHKWAEIISQGAFLFSWPSVFTRYSWHKSPARHAGRSLNIPMSNLVSLT